MDALALADGDALLDAGPVEREMEVEVEVPAVERKVSFEVAG